MKITKEQCEFERFLLARASGKSIEYSYWHVTTVDLTTILPSTVFTRHLNSWTAFILLIPFPSQDPKCLTDRLCFKAEILKSMVRHNHTKINSPISIALLPFESFIVLMAERLIIRFVREISQKSSNNRSIIKIIERNDLATGFQFDGGVIYSIAGFQSLWRQFIQYRESLAAKQNREKTSCSSSRRNSWQARRHLIRVTSNWPASMFPPRARDLKIHTMRENLPCRRVINARVAVVAIVAGNRPSA